MKKILSLAAILLCSFMVFAQTELIVHSSEQGLYLQHKVAPKETFYSLGRLYSLSPKDIETFNGLDMNKGLAIGQMVKIPLNASNFSQAVSKGRPVYYVVGTGEGLYRVSLKNSNVLMADLRKWNKLPGDQIKPGQKLIVGFLLPSSETDNIVQVTKEPEIKQQTTEKKEPVVQKQETVAVREEPKKEEPRQRNEQPVTRTISNVSVNDGNGGYFKSQFDLQIKSQPVKADQTASAGIFKTSSGWQDGKFYALIDNVEPGTIIKLINPTNNKAIYAKVLGEMSGIRQNQGYDVRISNAGATALGISETENDKFIVRVNY